LRSGNRGEEGGWVFSKGVKLVVLVWATKKVVAHHMTRGARGAQNGGCLKRASDVPETKVVR
jgi:hypothetical protein